ncbi:hypothetical protein SUGI_0679880 [Cryptomeria japonica]|uniref:protein DUF642 L-GALACTONO-1,4-LACTONE-RESPONSIVE GENE 2 n=1 Tax=Cryptomeria japonica TaxID=3369 RepID=UPI002414B3D0|nr:protein DUF642 L-GALACTONO-1,4-LACTONE-RESPONSIVE GENE 2 [Cryptomeria japonica]GLJ33813.1 hypothetical protein SUGI_0679880 [Cryptomeria japonica]
MQRSIALASAILLLLLSCGTAKEGMLPNGNFEIGPEPSNLKGFLLIGEDSLPYWRVMGMVEYIHSGRKPQDMVVVVPRGTHAVRLGNKATVVSHSVKVKKGSYYSLSFHAARTCAKAESLNISAPPVWGEISIQTVYASTGWDAYSWGFRAPADIVEFHIHNPGEEEDPACGPVVDGVALKRLRLPKFSGENLIRNGDFEEGPYVFPNASSGVLISPVREDAVTALPGWVVESLRPIKYIDAIRHHFAVPHGNAAVELIAGKENAISQTVRTTPGKKYILSFAVGDAGNQCKGKLMVVAFAGQESMKVPYDSQGKGGFKTATLSFTAASKKTRIVFTSEFYTMRSDDGVTFCGPVIDQITLR